MGKFFHLDGKRLEEWYRCHLSGFHQWRAREHAGDYLLFPENIGPYLSIDETALSYDELYTIVTNKEAKGRKGSVVAIVKGTSAETVIKYLGKMPAGKRRKVKEITLEMAANMELIARPAVFPRGEPCYGPFPCPEAGSGSPAGDAYCLPVGSP